jgi:hypothetical protein
MARKNGGGPDIRPGRIEYAIAIFTAVVLALALIGLVLLILHGP